MANQNIITSLAKLQAVGSTYYGPSAVLSTTGLPLASFYAFLAKVDPWPDENNPPVPTQDQASLKQIRKNIFVAKQIGINDISGVIQRIDWQSGQTYDYYLDNINMVAYDINNFLVYKFYVKNKYDQVFKCLWNNNGAPSTVEPYFEPGTYGTNNIFQGSDGYKWKYMYTIDIGNKIKFMDTNWIPVTLSGLVPSSLDNNIGSGDVEVINVTNGGSGYDPSNAAITITVTGDGIGASGTPIVQNGQITDIVVTNTGSNYTYANVSITSTIGSGATAIAPVSPISGHGADPSGELGCSHVMLTAQFSGNENGNIPTDISFHQVGIMTNPTSLSTYPAPANSVIYKTSTDLVLAQGFGNYAEDEIIFQGPNLNQATFKATVLSFDSVNNILKLINIVGTPTTNAPVFGNTSKTTRTLLSVSSPAWTTFSGYIVFVENRTGIQRSSDGIEQIKFVLGY